MYRIVGLHERVDSRGLHATAKRLPSEVNALGVVNHLSRCWVTSRHTGLHHGVRRKSKTPTGEKESPLTLIPTGLRLPNFRLYCTTIVAHMAKTCVMRNTVFQ